MKLLGPIRSSQRPTARQPFFFFSASSPLRDAAVVAIQRRARGPSPPLRNQESAPHLRLRRLALPPLRPLPGLQPVPPRRRVGDAGPSKKTVCSRIGRQPESRDTDHSYAGSCVKSISGAATTNRLVLRRSGESAQPTPGPAGVTGLIVFVLPLRRRERRR